MSSNLKEFAARRFRKRNISGNLNLSMNSEMLRFLIAVDEKKTISQVADELGLEIASLKDVVEKLLKHDIIEPVGQATAFIDQTAVETLRMHFIKAVGPLGSVFFDDILDEMGYSPGSIPKHQMAEVANMLASEINDQAKRLVFQETIVKYIRKVGT